MLPINVLLFQIEELPLAFLVRPVFVWEVHYLGFSSKEQLSYVKYSWLVVIFFLLSFDYITPFSLQDFC